MFKSLSTSLITRGILAVVVGIIALAWPVRCWRWYLCVYAFMCCLQACGVQQL